MWGTKDGCSGKCNSQISSRCTFYLLAFLLLIGPGRAEARCAYLILRRIISIIYCCADVGARQFPTLRGLTVSACGFSKKTSVASQSSASTSPKVDMLLPSKATWLVWDSSKADNLDPVYPGIKVQHVRLSPSSQLTLLPLPFPTFHILVS